MSFPCLVDDCTTLAFTLVCPVSLFYHDMLQCPSFPRPALNSSSCVYVLLLDWFRFWRWRNVTLNVYWTWAKKRREKEAQLSPTWSALRVNMESNWGAHCGRACGETVSCFQFCCRWLYYSVDWSVTTQEHSTLICNWNCAGRQFAEPFTRQFICFVREGK